MNNGQEESACERARRVLAEREAELKDRERELQAARDDENALLIEAAHLSITTLKATIEGVEGEIALLCGGN